MIERPDDFREWIADWQAETTASPRPTPAEEIRLHVRKRERWLRLWLMGDVVFGLGALAFLVHRVLTQPDPIEKLAMSLLALAVVGLGLFEAWTWRGSFASAAETPSDYLSVALDRSRRLRRSLRAGWPLLAAQVLIFTPWVWYQLYGDGTASSLAETRFAWGFLAFMVGLGALALSLAQRWVSRDARRLKALRQELIGDDTGGSL